MNSENKKSFSCALLVHPFNKLCETCGVYYGFDPGAEDPDEYAFLRAQYGITITKFVESTPRKMGRTARIQAIVDDMKAKGLNFLEVKAPATTAPFIPYDFQTKVFEEQLKELKKKATPADKWENFILNWFASYPR